MMDLEGMGGPWGPFVTLSLSVIKNALSFKGRYDGFVKTTFINKETRTLQTSLSDSALSVPSWQDRLSLSRLGPGTNR
jgi:hypothetical protein